MQLSRSLIPGSAGAVLTCCHTAIDPRRPSVLIALPFGVPCDVTRPALEAFGATRNVVTWESRYILQLDQAFAGSEPVAPDNHVEDMLCLLRALRISCCCLIGYCSGAGISLLAATRHPAAFSELILVNGEYQLFKHGHPSTDYQRSIDSFLPIVATGRDQAQLIFKTMAEISKASKSAAPSELEVQINLPFSTEESLFRCARNYMAYRDFDALALARQVRLRTLVVMGRQDVHSGTAASEAVADAIPGSRRWVDDGGDHYAFCRAGSPTLAAIMTQLASHAPDVASASATVVAAP